MTGPVKPIFESAGSDSYAAPLEITSSNEENFRIEEAWSSDSHHTVNYSIPVSTGLQGSDNSSSANSFFDACHNTSQNLGSTATAGSSKRQHRCTICNYAAISESLLVVHIRTHTGERPYKCHICLSRFSQKGTLVRHMRCHSGERPFQCSICLRKFIQKSDLRNHMHTHTGK